MNNTKHRVAALLADLYDAHPELRAHGVAARAKPRASRTAKLSGIDCRDVARAHGGSTGETAKRIAPPTIKSPGFNAAPLPTRNREACGPLNRRAGLSRHVAWDEGSVSRAAYERRALAAAPDRRAGMLLELLRHDEANDG